MSNTSKSKYKIIGICCADIRDENVKAITLSIGEEAAKQGYKTLIFTPLTDMYLHNSYTKGEACIYELINHELLEALVVLPEAIKDDNVTNKIIQRALADNLPVISVDRNSSGCSNVLFDYSGTFEKIVRHVIEDHKCTKVNFIAGQEHNPFSDERLDCYKKVLKENGIPVDETRIGYGDFWERPTRAVMERFLADERGLPEAIICCNDTMAITVCQVLQSKGIKVPEDVIVTGFDGIEVEKYISPRLTTASSDLEELGRTTIAMLDEITRPDRPIKTVRIPFKPRYSQSCGCEATSSQSAMDKVIELYNRIHYSEGHETFMFEYLSRTVDCKTSEELAAVISHYCDDYLWLCLNMDFYDNNAAKKVEGKSFTDTMNLFMMCHDKEVSSNRTFERKNLIPDLEAALDEHKYLMFTPLHFQDEVMGYAAVAFNSKDFVFSNTHRVINNTNQIFESFKNRQRLQAAYAEMAEMHMRDPMTGIYNRRGFYTNAKTLLKKGSDENMSTIIFSVDLDGLKDINDTYGHDMGDRAIKAVSDILSSFSSENAICSRFGGDEFILLAIDSEAGCCREKITAQINKAVDVWNDTHDKPFILRISLGCSAAQKCSEDMLEEIIKTADMQMYEQKRRHKARYKIMHNA